MTDSPSMTDWLTAGGTIVAAVATIATAIIALLAAKTWKEALQNQRYDECVAAAVGLEASINRCIEADRGSRKEEIWPTYTEAWDHQTAFRSAFHVALRYRPSVADDFPNRIDAYLKPRLQN